MLRVGVSVEKMARVVVYANTWTAIAKCWNNPIETWWSVKNDSKEDIYSMLATHNAFDWFVHQFHQRRRSQRDFRDICLWQKCFHGNTHNVPRVDISHRVDISQNVYGHWPVCCHYKYEINNSSTCMLQKRVRCADCPRGWGGAGLGGSKYLPNCRGP